MTCTVVGWVDTWALAASLRGRRKELVDSVTIRGEGAKSLREWQVMQRVLTELDEQAAKVKAEIGVIELEVVAPQKWTVWRRSPIFGAAIIPAVTNPAVFILSGVASIHAEAGSVTLVDQSWPWCVANWGTSPHIHLTAWLSTVKDE